jgi:hypothetical protein
MRPIRRQDWRTAPIEVGQYCNEAPLSGFQRRDGRGGNPLHPAAQNDGFEAALARTYASLREQFPHLQIQRYVVRMPYWTGSALPAPSDYVFVSTPQSLITTSITVLTVPRTCIGAAQAGFHYRGAALAPLRQRLHGRRFRGLIGNLGYYMTESLIQHKFPWSHNRRYPDHPLPTMPSYLGFHLSTDAETGATRSGFGGALPAAIGIGEDGTIGLLPRLEIDAYEVTLAGHTFVVDAVNDPRARPDVTVFTPGFHAPEIDALIVQRDSAAWQTFAPMMPLPDAANRLHIFVANRGNGETPVEHVVAVWAGQAPLPSFGAVLSFRRAWFERQFGEADRFRDRYLETPVQIVPRGLRSDRRYVRILGGLVPAVVGGQHVCRADNVPEMMARLTRYGNTTSPFARTGQESRNFDPHVREPAGLLVQTEGAIGWVLFDGRHELSIGASVVDALQILYRLDATNAFGDPLQAAVFLDGGSAMKLYFAESDGEDVGLELLNRVAAGSRNIPGRDADGLNLYSTLSLAL